MGNLIFSVTYNEYLEEEMATRSSTLAWKVPWEEPGRLQYMGSKRWASLVVQLIKKPPTMQETPVGFLGWEDTLEKDRLPTPVFLGLPGASDGKEFTFNVGNLGSIPGLGRSPGGGHSNSLQYSFLENPHKQRSLVGYSSWGHRVGQDWVTKHSTAVNMLLLKLLHLCFRHFGLIWARGAWSMDCSWPGSSVRGIL